VPEDFPALSVDHCGIVRNTPDWGEHYYIEGEYRIA
jgi:hypothetical protein